jgi:hypothetical protein
MNSNVELMDIGMKYLIERLGLIDAERFISMIIREQSDYTKWRQDYFGEMTSEEFHKAAMDYGKTHAL